MRVLLIDVNCKNSSTGKIVYDLYTGINENGDEAAICYGRGPLVEGKNIYKFGLDWETKIHALLTRLTGLTGCFSFFSTKRLLKLIDEFNPDVVHIHELHAYFVNIAMLLKFLAKKCVSVVWTFHCEFMYTGKCGHAYECRGFISTCGHCPRVNEYPKSMLFDFTKHMLLQKKNLMANIRKLTIITPSAWLADRVKQSFLGNRTIRVINNGIDTNVFRAQSTNAIRKELEIDNNEKVVLSVAPDIMSDRKGGKWVLQLAEITKEDCIKYILVGTNVNNVVHRKNVIFIPKITNQNRLAQFYSLADLFVICSEKETYSLTCAEAICCGTRVVGFECGAPETVFQSPFAIFSTYGVLDMLVDNVLTCLNDSTVTREECVLYGTANFSNAKMINQYGKAYRENADKI